MTLCIKPYTQGMHVYGCGRCMPCRIQRRRIWEHRITLETSLRADNAFCTLTYRPEDIPQTGSGLSTLDPKHLQDWLKRLRWTWKNSFRHTKNIAAPTLRFYAVGEYGDDTFRPHYHAALFGFPTCSYLRSRYSLRRRSCCFSCDLVRDTWGKGNVLLGTLEAASARYLAGYIEKKMTSQDDPRLEGRHPEFSRMSLRPGIGADMMDEVASTLLQFNLEDTEQGDVPSSLLHGKRRLPLGRYLRQRLRTRTGKEKNAPQTTIEAQAETMRPLLEAARRSTTHPSLKHQLLLANAAAVSSQAARSKLRKQRRKL